MKIVPSVFRSANAALSRPLRSSHLVRAFSASPFSGANNRGDFNSSESVDDFEQRIFNDGNRPGLSSFSFYQKLDRAEKAHDRSGAGFPYNFGNKSGLMDGLDEGHNSLTDGMDNKLKKAATYFDFDPDEVAKEDYTYRPDVNFMTGMNYDPKDLDLRKPGVWKPVKRYEFETTTKEVLSKADFRNVKFLAKFITEAGIIIKRSKTGISAKAQRKIAREIKTARAFGLMPFTTMGTKRFVYGATMEDEDRDFEYEANELSFVNDGGDDV